LTTITVDLIDVITVIAGPIIATMTGIDMIIAVTIVAMTDVMTTVATTITTGVMTARVIVVTTSVTTDETINVMTDVTKTTTTATTTIEKSGLHHHRPKGVTPTVRSNQPTERSTSSSAVAKRPKAIDRSDQTQERSGMSTLKPRSLCVGQSSQSLSPGKIIGVHIPDPGTYPLVVNPIVDGAFLPKTLIDGGSSLNIICTETLRNMDFDFNKMTACDEPFYGVVPGKVAYPIGRVCLPVTFSTKENIRT
jgi:hypothetical protein